MGASFGRLDKGPFQILLVFGLAIFLQVKQGLLVVDDHDAFHITIGQHGRPYLIPVGLHRTFVTGKEIIHHQEKDGNDSIKPVRIEFGPGHVAPGPSGHFPKILPLFLFILIVVGCHINYPNSSL